ncbi:MAG: hypothetical protein ABI844_04305 [Saprospiraceae bacterium]
MKKIFYLSFFVLLFANIASTQTEKGTWLLGGSAGYTTSKNSGSLIINPSVGYFVINNLAGGGQFSLVALKGASSYSLGPFIRYYFMGDDRGRFYASAGLNIGGGTGTKFGTGYSLGAGYALFLNESISINLGANFNKVGDNNNIFFLGAGFQIHFNSLGN